MNKGTVTTGLIVDGNQIKKLLTGAETYDNIIKLSRLKDNIAKEESVFEKATSFLKN